MKKYMAIILAVATLMLLAISCNTESTHPDTDGPKTANTESDTKADTVVTDTLEIELSEGKDSTVIGNEDDCRIVLLTQPYFNGYELTDTLDYDAFLEYLSMYFAEIIADDVMVVITDMIDSGGVVTVLTEYHDIIAADRGRRSCTVRGGGNLFFEYSTENGADFSEQLFAGVERLHNLYEPEPFIDGDYIFIDSNGYVGIHEWEGRVITTPAKYAGDCFQMDDIITWCCDDNHMHGKEREHYILAIVTEATPEENITGRSMTVYTTKDGGISWSEAELDYTPTTTDLVYPVTDISLKPHDLYSIDICSIILATNRCEVFYYVTEDGGVTWERRSNFKLLNYRYEAFLGGGMIFDDLAIMYFEARNGKNPNVYISRDGGYNWKLMDIPAPDGLSDAGAYVSSLYKWQSAVFMEVTYGDVIRKYVSYDHGDTWEWEGTGQ